MFSSILLNMCSALSDAHFAMITSVPFIATLAADFNFVYVIFEPIGKYVYASMCKRTYIQSTSDIMCM